MIESKLRQSVKKVIGKEDDESNFSVISLTDGLSDSDEDVQENRKMSINLKRLPSLIEEEYTYFELVKNGDLLGLKDFMNTKAFKMIRINRTDKYGYSALHHAVRRQDEEMTSLILSQKGILTYDTLFHAMEEENIEITKLILDHHDKNPFGYDDREPPYWLIKWSIETDDPEVQKKRKPMFYGLPRTLSPTNVTNQQSMQDLEEFDSEFPVHFTPLLVAARLGNFTLMEMFYERGERLENEKMHHERDCPCQLCYKNQKTASKAKERLDLFEAITNPRYICFIAEKDRNQCSDPANYAIQKIKRCQVIENQELMFLGKYNELVKRLSDFLKDLAELCIENDEALTFFSQPEEVKNQTQDREARLTNKYPRLWSLVSLNLVDVVAHPHSQVAVFSLWAKDDWPDYKMTNTSAYLVLQVLLRILLLPFIVCYMWVGFDTPTGRSYASPVSRYLNFLASYSIFLVILAAQVYFPQRCNHDTSKLFRSWNIDEWHPIKDHQCAERGRPSVGTEIPLILYILGFFVSLIKKHSIPWFWKSPWSWFELATQGFFVATFTSWAIAWYQSSMRGSNGFFEYPREPRNQWEDYYPEILADIFLTLSCICSFLKVFRLIQLHRENGPLQIGLGRMVYNFLTTFIVYVVLLVSFLMGFYTIYIPFEGLPGRIDTDNQTSPFGNIIKAPEELFWSLFGMSGSDKPKIIELKRNHTPNSNMHPIVSEIAGKFLFGSYHILGVLMAFNMLVAYFSAGFDEVRENEDVEWKFGRTQVYLTVIKDTVLPPPFNLIPTLRGIIRFFQYIGLLFVKEPGMEASWNWKQCCFLRREEVKERVEFQKEEYRIVIVRLIHRYKSLLTERANQIPATNDDVKEIGEELTELKALLKAKLREMEDQVKESKKQNDAPSKSKPRRDDADGDAGGGKTAHGSSMETSKTKPTALKPKIDKTEEDSIETEKESKTKPENTRTTPTSVETKSASFIMKQKETSPAPVVTSKSQPQQPQTLVTKPMQDPLIPSTTQPQPPPPQVIPSSTPQNNPVPPLESTSASRKPSSANISMPLLTTGNNKIQNPVTQTQPQAPNPPPTATIPPATPTLPIRKVSSKLSQLSQTPGSTMIMRVESQQTSMPGIVSSQASKQAPSSPILSRQSSQQHGQFSPPLNASQRTSPLAQLTPNNKGKQLPTSTTTTNQTPQIPPPPPAPPAIHPGESTTLIRQPVQPKGPPPKNNIMF